MLMVCTTDKPPTVLEFRAMARRAPADEVPRLPTPKADPERIAAELAKLAPLRKRSYVEGRDWARRILEKHEAKARNDSYFTINMAREVMRGNGVTA